MALRPNGKSQKSPPPDETGREAGYLKQLAENQTRVCIKLRDGEQVRGWIEYYDNRMVRLTRDGSPNLFIFKDQIHTITEEGA